jgi:hypothetical protein
MQAIFYTRAEPFTGGVWGCRVATGIFHGEDSCQARNSLRELVRLPARVGSDADTVAPGPCNRNNDICGPVGRRPFRAVRLAKHGGDARAWHGWFRAAMCSRTRTSTRKTCPLGGGHATQKRACHASGYVGHGGPTLRLRAHEWRAGRPPYSGCQSGMRPGVQGAPAASSRVSSSFRSFSISVRSAASTSVNSSPA